MRRQRNNKLGLKIVLIILLVIILILGAFALLIYPGETIAKGVSVDGISLEKMTINEAEKSLKTESLMEQKIILKDENGNKVEFLGRDIDLKKDTEASCQKAFEVGRNKGFLKDIKELINAFFYKEDLKYVVSYDKEELAGIVYDFGVSVIGEQKNYDIEFGTDTVTIKKGQEGQSRDVTNLVEQVEKSFENYEYEILLTLKSEEAPTPGVDSIYNEIFSEPKDASYEIKDGKLIITPEIVGRNIDKEEIKSQIDKITSGGAITLKVQTTMPEITEKSINESLFGYSLGQYSSSYATSTKNRADNVELAARKINGYILMPGEEFSYNKVVGRRTTENGFKEAPVFANGDTVQGLGGGVCQVSSTLYSAVLYADLQVLERKSHSMTVSYVPKGQDATVSYGSIDFRFKNNTKNPIKISVTTGGKKVNVSILGAKPEKNKTVKIINTVTSTKNSTTEEVVTAGMKAGERKTISNGKTGYNVTTVRKVYEDGKEIKSETMKASSYKMVPTKVAVGEEVKPTTSNTIVEENDSNKTEKETNTIKRPKANEETEDVEIETE